MNKALTLPVFSVIASLGAAACGSSSSPSNTNDSGTASSGGAASGSPDGSMGSGSSVGSGDAGGDSSSGSSPSGSGTVSGDAGDAGGSGSSASGSSGSSSDGGGTCKTVAPCGGDLVGTWTITGACSADPEMSSSTCGDGGMENDTTSVTGGSGTVTFNADGTYALSITLTVQDTDVVPLSCVSVGGVQGTCDDLKNRLAAELPDGEAASLMCTSSATQCSCELSGPFGMTSSTGTYVVSGNTFTTNKVDGGGGGSVTSYCVQGNTLYVTSGGDEDAGTSLVSQIAATR